VCSFAYRRLQIYVSRFRDQIPVMQFQCPCRMFRASPGSRCSKNNVQKLVGIRRFREQVQKFAGIRRFRDQIPVDSNVHACRMFRESSRVQKVPEPSSGVCRNQEVQEHVPLVPMTMQDVQGKYKVPMFHELCSEVCGNREVQGTDSIGSSDNAGCSVEVQGPNFHEPSSGVCGNQEVQGTRFD
jgi:hypothetical protein